MTVPTNDNREQYQGNGSATVFPYAFRIFDSTDLQVYLTEEDGMQSLLVEGSDYTVSGAGDEDGGNVTYPVSGDPLADGETLTILRVIDITQETDLRNQGAYYPEVVEDEFDRSRMIDQQLQEQSDRSLKQRASGGGYSAEGARITQVGDAEDGQDAITKGQVDDRFESDVITQESGAWDAKAKRLSNMAPPVQQSDAATKGYSDEVGEESRDFSISEVEKERQRAVAAEGKEAQERAAGDASLQSQLSGTTPLESSAFSPISWHSQSIKNSVDIPENVNAWSFGPSISLDNGAVVTIGDGSFWTIADGFEVPSSGQTTQGEE